MVAYHEFVELSQSGDSEARGRAAHFAACAFVAHRGPADEQAALYAALVGFLDDSSVKVRAALAYGLLHAKCAPRPIMLSLLQDAPVIARAIAQYSPSVVDADLIGVTKTAEPTMLAAIAARVPLGARVATALLARGHKPVSLAVLAREDVVLPVDVLDGVVVGHGADAKMRGALLGRKELSTHSRHVLIEAAREAIAGARIVHGAIAPARLDRLMRNAADNAVTTLGERDAAEGDRTFAKRLIAEDKISSRLMLHALVRGHVLFFADCLGLLAGLPSQKVFMLLNRGSRAALNALLAKCGFNAGLRNLLARLVFYARAADLSDNLSARHFVVTALLDELMTEHDGVIPDALEDAFNYLGEQNIALARHAARGIMPAFAQEVDDSRQLEAPSEPQLFLPAA